MGNFQALQPRAQVTFNLLTVIHFSEPIMPLSTISVIYVIEDAVFFDKRIRYLKACAVENVSKFHFLQV